MLWEYIEEKMLRHPDSTLKEGEMCIRDSSTMPQYNKFVSGTHRST